MVVKSSKFKDPHRLITVEEGCQKYAANTAFEHAFFYGGSEAISFKIRDVDVALFTPDAFIDRTPDKLTKAGIDIHHFLPASMLFAIPDDVVIAVKMNEPQPQVCDCKY